MADSSLPPTKPYNRRLWEAAEEGSFEIQRCDDCAEYVYPPRSRCPHCFGSLSWIEAAGTGTIYSYAVVHHPDPPSAVPDDELPMVGAIVTLSEGVRFATVLVDADPEAVEIGMDVTVTFRESASGRTLPVFELA